MRMGCGASVPRILAMFKNVLVLADGHDARHPALRRAISLVAEGGEIEVLTVVYEPMLDAYLGNKDVHASLRERVLKERQERVATLARAVESEGVRSRAKAVWAHPLHEAIAAEVTARRHDLVIVAPTDLHGDGAKRAGLTHSDWQIVTRCPAPLLVVAGDGQSKYRQVVAAVDPFHSHAKPGSLDVAILRCASAVATRCAGALRVVHCYPPADYPGAELAHVPARAPDFIGQRERALHALCAEAGVAAADARLVAGMPHVVLASLQARGEADLVVMGVFARSRIKELILGNTAERVLHGGAGDVLVIKPGSP